MAIRAHEVAFFYLYQHFLNAELRQSGHTINLHFPVSMVVLHDLNRILATAIEARFPSLYLIE